jgi:hypothetical protein
VIVTVQAGRISCRLVCSARPITPQESINESPCEIRLLAPLAVGLARPPQAARAQAPTTTHRALTAPKEYFGFNIGDDY